MFRIEKKVFLFTLVLITGVSVCLPCNAKMSQLTESEQSFLIKKFKNQDITVTAMIDQVRQFVYNNSEHKEPFDQQKWNTDLMIKNMILVHKNKSKDRPRMTCGPRSRSMMRILRLIGIKSYMVQIYTDNKDTFQSHTFLNVYNEDTKKWEAHDPDYNLIYLDATNQRVDVQTLLFSNLEKITPIFNDGKKQVEGWNSTNNLLKDDFFEAVMLWDAFINGSSLLIVNQNKFDLTIKKNDYTQTNKDKVDFLHWCNSIYRDQWGKKFYISLP